MIGGKSALIPCLVLSKMAVSCVSIERMSPEELAKWLTDKGFNEEVGKAFISMFVYGFVNVIKRNQTDNQKPY